MTYLKKLDPSLNLFEENSHLLFFGDWINNIEQLSKTFSTALPFEHIVIDNFLDTNYAKTLLEKFPIVDKKSWHEYMNPIEIKYAFDNISELDPEVRNYFYLLSHHKVVKMIEKLTQFEDLKVDEYLHGAGLHAHPRDGKLNVHLDYEIHPFTGMERKLNIILFLSDNWDPSWNGANELWDKNHTKCITRTHIKFNRAIIFKTTDDSWHGLPTPIQCPESIFRKSIAYYYVSDKHSKIEKKTHRLKAEYIVTDNDITLEHKNALEKLCEIRKDRRITNEDIDTITPFWKSPYP